MHKKVITRRQFIKDTTLAALGSSLILGVPGNVWAQPQKKSMVILVRNKEVLDNNGTPREEVIRTMLDQALTLLTGKKDPVAAWKTIIMPDDTVGIKTNVWQYIPTTAQVEQVLKRRHGCGGTRVSNQH